MVHYQPQRNRDHHDLQNAEQHPHHVHLNMRIHVQTRQQRVATTPTSVKPMRW